MKECHADALETAVFAGNILLESGAEIFRVEETVLRIAKAYGVQSCNTFVLSSGLFTTAGGPREEYFAQVRHIPLRAVRLDKVELVNQLSREIVEGKHTVEEAYAALQEIANRPKKDKRLRTLACGLGAGSFCYFFGGTIMDCLAALCCGLVLHLYLLLLEGKKLSKITTNVTAAAVSTLCAILACQVGLGQNLNPVIIGSIIPLVPGVSFTNAIRDIADGDYIAGSVRLLDALLIAFCIAGGVGIVYTLALRILGGGMLL